MDDDTSGGTTGVTRDELEQLKQDAVVCVNESLFKKLQQIEQVGTRRVGTTQCTPAM